MSKFANLRKAAAKVPASQSPAEAIAALSQDVPARFTLAELVIETQVAPDEDPAPLLLQVLACLCSRRGEDGADGAARDALARFIGRAMAPTAGSGRGSGKDVSGDGDRGRDADADADEGEDEAKVYARVSERSKALAGPGIEALRVLADGGPDGGESGAADGREDVVTVDKGTGLPDEVLVILAAFTDPEEDWADTESSTASRGLLREQLGDRRRWDRFVVDTVLQAYLRPLFSQSKPATVTASGRKAAFSEHEDDRIGLSDETSKTKKPWKHRDWGAISVVSWAVHEADELFISKNWPLFVPVLLTLVDEPTTRIRARGLHLLGVFLHKCPAQMLRDTGLANVFEDAVFPTLLYLPTLTPPEESVQLLPPAYEALVRLAQKFPENPHDCDGRQRLLRKVMREGILAGYTHAGDHPRIVRVLVQQLSTVVLAMGPDTISHLKDIFPMLCAIITDPFALGDTETLLSAIRALQATITQAWARMSGWQNEMLKSSVVCWLHVEEDTISEATHVTQKELVRRELINTATIVAAVLKARGGSLTDLTAPLVSKHPSLAGLFNHAS